MKNLLVTFVLVFSFYLHYTTGVSFRDKTFCEENGAFPEGILDCSSNELIHVELLRIYSGHSCTSDDRFMCGTSLFNNIHGLAPDCTTKGSCRIALPNKPNNCSDQVSINVNYRCIEEKVHDVCEPILDSKSHSRLFFSTPGYPKLSPLDSPVSCRCDIEATFVTSVAILDLTFNRDAEVLVLNGNATVLKKTSTDSPLRTYNEKKHSLEYSKSLRITFNQRQSNQPKLWIEVEGISMSGNCSRVALLTTTESTRSSKANTTLSLPSTSTTISSTTRSSISSTRPSTVPTSSYKPSTSSSGSSSTSSPTPYSSSSTPYSSSSTSYSSTSTNSSTRSSISSTRPSTVPTSSYKPSTSSSGSSSKSSPTPYSSSSTPYSSSSTFYSSSSLPSTISSSKASPSRVFQSITSSSTSSTLNPQPTTPKLDTKGISYGTEQVCEKDGKFPVLNLACKGDGKINVEIITYYTGTTCDAIDRFQCGQALTNSSNGLVHNYCDNRTPCGAYVPDKPRECTGIVSAIVNYRCITDTLHNVCGSTIVANRKNRLFLSTPGYPQLSPFNQSGQCSCNIRGSNITSVNMVDMVLENSTVNVADGSGRSVYNVGDIGSRKRVYNMKVPFTFTTSIRITFQHQAGSFQKLWIEVQGINMVGNCSSGNITTTSNRPNIQTSTISQTEKTTANPTQTTSNQKTITRTFTDSTPISQKQGTTPSIPTVNSPENVTLSTKQSLATNTPATASSNSTTSTRSSYSSISSVSNYSVSITTHKSTKPSGPPTSSNSIAQTTISSTLVSSIPPDSSSSPATTLKSTISMSPASSSRTTPTESTNNPSTSPSTSKGSNPPLPISTDSQTSTSSTNQSFSKGTTASTASLSASARTTPSGSGGSTVATKTDQDVVSYQPSSTTATGLIPPKSTSSSTVTPNEPTTKPSPSLVMSSPETTTDDVIGKSSTLKTSRSSQQSQTTSASATERTASTSSHQETSGTQNTATSGPSAGTPQSSLITESTRTTGFNVSEQTSKNAYSTIPTGQTSPGFSSEDPGLGTSVGTVTNASVNIGGKTELSTNPNIGSQVRSAHVDTTTLAIVGSIAGFFLLMCFLVAIFVYRRRKDRNEEPIVDGDTESETGTTSFEVPYNTMNGSQYSRGYDNNGRTLDFDDEQTEVKQLKSILKKSPENSTNPSPRSSSYTPDILSLDEEPGYSTVFHTPHSAAIPSLDVSPKSLVPKDSDGTDYYSESDYATVNRAGMKKYRQPADSEEATRQPSSSSTNPPGGYEISTHRPVSTLEEKKPTSIRLPSRSSRYGEKELTIYY